MSKAFKQNSQTKALNNFHLLVKS